MKVVLSLILILFGQAACSQARADTVIPFEGMMDLRSEHLALRFGEGDRNAVVIDLHRSPADTLTFSVDLRHIRLPFFDLAAVVEGAITFTGSRPSIQEAAGEVRSKYTLVNQKPVRDLYLKFALRERKLIIDRLWAGAFSGSGQIDLSGEHRSSLSFEVVSSDLEHIFDLFQSTPAVLAPPVSGTLTGWVNLSGPLMAPLVKGRVAAYNGCFKALCYESILLQLAGTFPDISLDDSVVTHADGFNFNIAGSVDLSDLARLTAQIRQLRKMPVISAAQNKREWILKRQRSDTNRNSVTEMKYLWLKDERGEPEGVLGFGQKFGF